MKLVTLAALLGSGAPLASAHYIFSQLIVNGQSVGGDYTYIRKNSNDYQPDFPDILTSTDMRCNKGARANSGTSTYTVKAGDRVAAKLWYNEFIEHPGPEFVYMSKAPSSVASYDGSGDWFKVHERGLCNGRANVDSNWCSWQKDRVEFQIPSNIPPGEYLVRFEHIGLHEGHVNNAQFYMECAQLKIEGSGGGNPSPLAKIPGIYSASDPGIAYNKWTSTPADYVMPGPKVWSGGGSSSSTSSGSTSSGSTSSDSTSSSCAGMYGQCGGTGWSGSTCCSSGTCKYSSEYYSQCL